MSQEEYIEPEVVNDKLEQEHKTIEEKNSKKKFWSYIFLIAAMIYGAIPTDILPDMPVIGWIDDFVIGSAALTNFVQQQFFQTNEAVNKLLKTIKFILIALAVLITLVVILLITLIVKS